MSKIRTLLFIGLMAFVSATASATVADSVYSFKDLKAINTDAVYKFFIPQHTRVVTAKKGMYYNLMYLWDGTDGVEFYVSSFDDVFGSTPEKGQLVSGDITAMFMGQTYYYFYYKPTTYPDCASNLSLGAKENLEPLTVTLSQLQDSASTRAYDWSYVKMTGDLSYDGNYATTLFTDGGEVKLSKTLCDSINFLEPLNAHKVNITGILERNAEYQSYELMLIDSTSVEDLGEAPVKDVEYDALASNTITAEPVANVTIKNLNYEAGKYYNLILPFEVNLDTLKAAFGEGTQVYTPATSRSTELTDTLMFNTPSSWVKTIFENRPMLIKPAVAVRNATFHKVKITAEEPEIRIFWPYTYFDAIVKDSIYEMGTYAPLNTSAIDTAYVMDPDANFMAGATVNAFSAYFVIPSGTQTRVVAKADSIIITPENGTSSMATVMSSQRSATHTYNLNGQMMPEGNLPKGIYIRKGKKYIVK